MPKMGNLWYRGVYVQSKSTESMESLVKISSNTFLLVDIENKMSNSVWLGGRFPVFHEPFPRVLTCVCYS